MSSRRRFVRDLVVGGVVGGALGSFVDSARARPVPTGRFVRIPHGVPSDHPWRTGGGSPRRDFRTATLVPRVAPTRRWEARVGVGRCFTPALSREGLLHVASQAGVGCVDTSGRVLWSLRVGLPSGTPAFTPDGEVAIGLAPTQVAVVGAGGLRVLATLAGAVRGSPLVLDDGSVVVAALDQAVHRIDGEGRVIFRTAIATQVRGAVTQVGPRLFAVPAGASVVFVEPDGRTRATVELPSDVALDLAATEGGEVFAVGVDGTLSRLGPSGVRFSARTGITPSLTSGIALGGDGRVRFGSRERGLAIVDASGTVIDPPESELARGVTSELAVDAEGASVVVDARGALVAFEPDGRVRWELATNNRADAAPVLGADGTIYVASFGGTLAAYGS